MKSVLNLYKKLYETPLQTIERFKLENPEYKDVPMTYAGRLDPMAEGVSVVLAGEECKSKEKYLGLDKVYEFEMLLGIETDSLDLLGLVTDFSKDINKKEISKLEIENIAKGLIGEGEQEYPFFSSKTVGGKQLFQIFKDGDEIEELPKRKVNIYDLKILEMNYLLIEQLKEKIAEMLKNIKGDFRQEEIEKSWQNFFEQNKIEKFQICKMEVKCSSGTYVRKISEEVGNLLNFPAVTLSILRKKVGDYLTN